MKVPVLSKILGYLGIKNQIVQSLPRIYDDSAWNNYLSGKGYAVSASTALKVAVVIRCADVVAKTMASLGCHLYKTETAGKSRAVNNPIYKLLRTMPNSETTAYEFWHFYVFSLMLTSGAYAKIVRDQNGFIREIWNIPSCNVTLNRNPITKERYIDVAYANGSRAGVAGERIYEPNFMYTPGLRYQNDEYPEDFIRIASDVLGLTMNLNSYARDYFENGSNMGGFVEYPNAINAEAFARFKNDWQKTYSGVINQHKIAILEGGFKFTKFDSNPEQSQALESREFQVIEVCRIMGVTPHKCFSLKGVNYNSIEQLNIEFWQETVDPMDERIGQTIFKDLLSVIEQKKHFARFNTNKLLKGDIAARTTYYHNARQDGWMNANDIRRLEDMDDIPDADGGNIYAINGNMIPLSSVPQNLPKGAQKAGNNTENKV